MEILGGGNTLPLGLLGSGEHAKNYTGTVFDMTAVCVSGRHLGLTMRL